MEVFEKKVTAEVVFDVLCVYTIFMLFDRSNQRDQRQDTRESRLQILTCLILIYQKIMYQIPKNKNKKSPPFFLSFSVKKDKKDAQKKKISDFTSKYVSTYQTDKQY